MDHNEKKKIRNEMDPVVIELMKHGVQHNTTEEEMTGLGDLVESTLQKFGITEEKFKQWFNLKECNCTRRKKWLNNMLSWKKKQ